MSPVHRQLVFALLLLLGLSATARLWPLRAGSFPACRFPAVLWQQGGQPQLFCLPRQRAALAAVAGPRLGPCAARGSLQAGQLLQLSSDCRQSSRQIPGAIRLTLGLPLELNRCLAADLAALPGVGPVLAARIVAERARKGPFCRVHDLQRVRGIGPALLRRLGPQISASPPCPQPQR